MFWSLIAYSTCAIEVALGISHAFILQHASIHSMNPPGTWRANKSYILLDILGLTQLVIVVITAFGLMWHAESFGSQPNCNNFAIITIFIPMNAHEAGGIIASGLVVLLIAVALLRRAHVWTSTILSTSIFKIHMPWAYHVLLYLLHPCLAIPLVIVFFALFILNIEFTRLANKHQAGDNKWSFGQVCGGLLWTAFVTKYIWHWKSQILPMLILIFPLWSTWKVIPAKILLDTYIKTPQTLFKNAQVSLQNACFRRSRTLCSTTTVELEEISAEDNTGKPAVLATNLGYDITRQDIEYTSQPSEYQSSFDNPTHDGDSMQLCQSQSTTDSIAEEISIISEDSSYETATENSNRTSSMSLSLSEDIPTHANTKLAGASSSVHLQVDNRSEQHSRRNPMQTPSHTATPPSLHQVSGSTDLTKATDSILPEVLPSNHMPWLRLRQAASQTNHRLMLNNWAQQYLGTGQGITWQIYSSKDETTDEITWFSTVYSMYLFRILDNTSNMQVC
jgi:hypothetical protein